MTTTLRPDSLQNVPLQPAFALRVRHSLAVTTLHDHSRTGIVAWLIGMAIVTYFPLPSQTTPTERSSTTQPYTQEISVSQQARTDSSPANRTKHRGAVGSRRSLRPPLRRRQGRPNGSILFGETAAHGAFPSAPATGKSASSSSGILLLPSFRNR